MATPLQEVIEDRRIESVYQPIVELTSGNVVGYEALTRGPSGTPLESPLALFGSAEDEGLISQLDWLCRASAFQGALQMELYPPLSLFVNFHPDSLAEPLPPQYESLWERAQSSLAVVVEVTESSLLRAPADMLRNLHRMRSRGWLIALDDIGAHPESLALLPFVDPDIIKMDIRLIHEAHDIDIAAIVAAVNAHAETTGALILAEGVENDEHVLRAMSMGASLGQGWKWGRPAPLPQHRSTPTSRLPRVNPTPYRPAASLFARLQMQMTPRPVSLSVLQATSQLIEHMAYQSGSAACLFSSYYHPDEYQAVAPWYREIARQAALTAVYLPTGDVAALQEAEAAIQLPVSADTSVWQPNTTTHSDTSRVRFAPLQEDDPLREEWATVLLSPHQSAALVARPLSGDLFECIVTYDRQRVLQAAQTLMARLI